MLALLLLLLGVLIILGVVVVVLLLDVHKRIQKTNGKMTQVSRTLVDRIGSARQLISVATIITGLVQKVKLKKVTKHGKKTSKKTTR